MAISEQYSATAPATAALPTGSPRVSVVIPARDEARNLPLVLGELPVGLHEVILVDGGSQDGTVAAARRVRPDVRVVTQSRCGKGNALACGIAECTGDIAVLLDADYSADPAEIAAFVEKLEGGADVVKGSRFLREGGSSDLTVLRRAGNKTLLFLMNRLYRTSFSDLCYGYNAFWTRCSPALELPSAGPGEAEFGDGFEFETVFAAHAATARLEIGEVPSFERDRRFGVSHLHTWRDGWRCLHAILRERLPWPNPQQVEALPVEAMRAAEK
ncbi:glycosyltransferase family 2 protein [Actinospica robiniae]|uniref:glycosyltransferase family 2 protein n=1 Tax=Actinospica robiniae TaxID=304901 RepID=UPI0003FC15DC|nr:glycosyltransferase family 2 protein [Actinospica robiniae]